MYWLSAAGVIPERLDPHSMLHQVAALFCFYTFVLYSAEDIIVFLLSECVFQISETVKRPYKVIDV